LLRLRWSHCRPALDRARRLHHDRRNFDLCENVTDAQ